MTKTTISILAILLLTACAPKNSGNPVYNPQIIRACPVKTLPNGENYCAWTIEDVREIYKVDAEAAFFRKHSIMAKERWLYVAITAVSLVAAGLALSFSSK